MVNIDVPAGVGAPQLNTTSETKKLLFKNAPMQGEGFLWELINTKKLTNVFLENIPGSYGCSEYNFINCNEQKVTLYSKLPNGEYPICLQTTEASLLSHELAQIVLHLPLMHSSTFPWFDIVLYVYLLFTTRTAPCWHGPSVYHSKTSD